MLKKSFSYLVILIATTLTVGCSGLFQKDNTPPPAPLKPLASNKQPTLLWATKTGTGSGNYYLKLNPSKDATAIYTASNIGTVVATDKSTGQIRWRTKLGFPITTGLGIGENTLIVGTNNGHILALNKVTGQKIWDRRVPGEVLATPVIADSKVIVKTMDGQVLSLALADGDLHWRYAESEPNLVLRAASKPLVYRDYVIAGFANGNLANLTLGDGGVLWKQQIAVPEGGFTLQRMIDVDADPVVFEHQLLAATYQGKLSSMDFVTGKINWNKNLSSYTGMTVDAQNVYVSDAKGYVWALQGKDGILKWRQEALSARTISAPANSNQYVVVGDAEGYLHWLAKGDGKLVARASTGKAPIYSSPMAENNRIYAFASDGTLYAYELKS